MLVVDLIGRELGKQAKGYGSIGDTYTELDGVVSYLSQDKKEQLPLKPQGKVTQFNSTYIELVDRWDTQRGLAAGLFLAFFCLGMFGFTIGLLLIFSFISDKDWLLLSLALLFQAFLSFLLYGIYRVIRRELFNYRYFPLRFNRKTGKVHIIHSNHEEQTFDWETLAIHIQRHDGVANDVRCNTVENGIITQAFSLPYLEYDEQLLSHFEFVKRYMLAETDDELAEVKAAVTQLHPMHKGKESISDSFRLSQRWFYFSKTDLEAPVTFADRKFVFLFYPFWALHFVGRVLCMLTSKTPQFSLAVEEACLIDPDDPHNLNKNPPEPQTVEESLPVQLLQKFLYAIMILISLSLIALFLDMFGAMRPHRDYPSLFKMLWDVLLFRWV